MKFDKVVVLIFLVIILICLSLESTNENAVPVMAGVNERVVVIDAGHGGFDPGRVGVSGDDEKNINLEIAMILQNYFEEGGAIVFVTRNEDEALGDSKKSDMSERKEISEESEADIFISIHQNSFPKTSAKGAQTFYYENSVEGERLANSIQNRLISVVDSQNTRVAKGNTDYYILKQMEMPSVIVECGFISNPSEEKLLNTEEYKEKIAWAIYLGAVDYFNE